jgi:hypothetical protein
LDSPNTILAAWRGDQRRFVTFNLPAISHIDSSPVK